MADTLAPVHDALDELKALLADVTDPAERRGLEAFIKCVTPHLLDEVTTTFLGKIAQVVQASVDVNETNPEQALEALREHFEVVVE